MSDYDRLMAALPDATAELVQVKCPNGHVFNYIGNDARDRESWISCPNCQASASEYGYWVTDTVALMNGNKIVFASAEDVLNFKIEVLPEGEEQKTE